MILLILWVLALRERRRLLQARSFTSATIFQHPDEALSTVVALGLPHEGRGGFHPEECDLALEVVGQPRFLS